MFLEKIDGANLLILALVDCRISSPEKALDRFRSRFPKIQTQLMRADRICGKEHLIFAARNAVRAFTQPYKRSNSLAVEFLLYVSCQRQISRAIEVLGVTTDTREIVLAAYSEVGFPHRFIEEVPLVLKGSPDDSVLENLTKRKMVELMQTYGVTKVELATAQLPGENRDSVLKRLIIERSVLLAVEG